MSVISDDNKPPRGYDVSGWTNTGQLRVRPGWFGFAVVEELHESRSGEREWRRIWYPHTLTETK